MELIQHKKIQDLNGANQHIGCFIDFLREEKDMILAERVHDDLWDTARLVPITQGLEKLMAEYFEIDMDVLEDEKRFLLKEQMKLNEQKRK